MSKPKAKWSRYEDGQRVWTAAVGPFYLEADGDKCRAEISEWEPDSGSIGDLLWEQSVPMADVPDLMRLAEAELARRLEHTAETMDGSGLVAPIEVTEVSQEELLGPYSGTPESRARQLEHCHSSSAQFSGTSGRVARLDFRLPATKFNPYQERAAELARKCVEYACKVCGTPAKMESVLPDTGEFIVRYRADEYTVRFVPGCKCAQTKNSEAISSWSCKLCRRTFHCSRTEFVSHECVAAPDSGPNPGAGCSRRSAPAYGFVACPKCGPRLPNGTVELCYECIEKYLGVDFAKSKRTAAVTLSRDGGRCTDSHGNVWRGAGDSWALESAPETRTYYGVDPGTDSGTAIATVELKDGQMKVVDVKYQGAWSERDAGMHTELKPLEGSRAWAIAMMREGKTVVDRQGAAWQSSSSPHYPFIRRDAASFMSYRGLHDDMEDGWRLA